MSNKNIEDLQKGDIVFYKHPRNNGKSYGEFLEIEFSNKGDIAIIKDQLIDSGKFVKIPVKELTGVMEKFNQSLREAKQSIEALNKDLLKQYQSSVDQFKIEKATGVKISDIKDYVKSYTSDVIKLAVNYDEKSEYTEPNIVIKVPETSIIYDDNFASNDFMNFNALIRVNPLTNNLDVTISNPINKTVSIDLSDKAPLEVLGRTLSQIEDTVKDIAGKMKDSKNQFAIKYGNLINNTKTELGEIIANCCESRICEDALVNSKYRLTDEHKTVDGVKLYRIEAVKDFGSIKLGDKGGFIESEKNLSTSGNCWVYDNACVYSGARVFGDAKIMGNAKIYGFNTKILGDTEIGEYAEIYGDKVSIIDGVKIGGNAEISGKFYARDGRYGINITGDAKISGTVELYGNVSITNKVKLSTPDEISKLTIDGSHHGKVLIYDDVNISASGFIDSNGGEIVINGKTEVTGGKFTVFDSAIITDMIIDGQLSIELKDELKIISPETVGEKEIFGTKHASVINSVKQLAKTKELKSVNEAKNYDETKILKNPEFADVIETERVDWTSLKELPIEKVTDDVKKYIKELERKSVDSAVELTDFTDWYNADVEDGLLRKGATQEYIAVFGDNEYAIYVNITDGKLDGFVEIPIELL